MFVGKFSWEIFTGVDFSRGYDWGMSKGRAVRVGVQINMQEYKSQRAAAVICVTLVNRDRQTDFERLGYTRLGLPQLRLGLKTKTSYYSAVRGVAAQRFCKSKTNLR